MGQDKSEIPKSFSTSQDFLTVPHLGSDMGGGSLNSGKSDGTLNLEVAQWLSNEAKVRLQESLIKLNIDMSKINGKHLLNYSYDELLNEKKKVKNELKLYD